ncbi:MAG: CsgG/HfaB family protein [Candidatus Sericytochromatia bacterium]
MLKKFLFLISSYFFINIAFLSNAEAKKIIAVLPFEVLSDNTEYKQFGLGTTDSLSVALTTIPDFIMVERGKISSIIKEQGFQNSGFTDDKNSVKLGKILGAQVLVVGTIQVFEKQFRIVSSFIEVETGRILKAIKVTGSNIFDLQDKLAENLIENQNIMLSNDKKNEITKVTKATQNLEAYNYFTSGKTFYYNYIEHGFIRKTAYSLDTKQKMSNNDIIDNLTKSIEYFNKALAIDNNYSLAYSAKAESELALASFYYFKLMDKNKKDEITNLFESAKKDAYKSLELNPLLPQTYRAIGTIKYYEKKIDEAISYNLRALELNPNDGETLLWLSSSYFSKAISEKDIDKKIESLQNAIKYNKNYLTAYKLLATYLNKKEKIDESETILEQALEIDPKDKDTIEDLKKIYYKKASLNFQNKNYLNTINYYKKILNFDNKNAELYSNLGINYFITKDYKNTEEMYKKAIELDPKNNTYYYNLAVLYDVIKEKDKAEEFYKKACDLGFKTVCK